MLCEKCSKEIGLKKTRSLKQNNYMHGVPYQYLCAYFAELGYTKDDVHEICKHKFLSHKQVVVEGESLDIYHSTTTLTTGEMEEYLENIRRWAARLGCNIPEPNEKEESCTQPK